MKYTKVDQIMDVVRNGLLVMQYHARKIDEERAKMFRLLREVENVEPGTSKDAKKPHGGAGGSLN